MSTPRPAVAVLFLSTLAACHGEPELFSASPGRVSARGGEVLSLRGSGFADDAIVRLGGERLSAVSVVSDEEIRVTTPPLFAGPVSVSVETARGIGALPGGVEVLALDLRFAEAAPTALAWDATEPVVGAAVGDFDGDGDLDLVTCGSSCRLLVNDGQGNLAPAPAGKSGPSFPLAALDARAVAAADLDGDGDLDVVVGTGSEGPGVVYRNDGAGRFVATGSLPPLADPVTALALGDLDGDGLPDLVIADGTADAVPLRVFRNRSHGASIVFAAADEGMLPAREWVPKALALVDVDDDGALDIVLATPGAADGVPLRLLLRRGDVFQDGSARLPEGLAGAVAALAAGDVNGDGAVDLVAVGDGQDRLLLNDGTGHFFDATVASLPLDAVPGTSVALVDLDRDCRPDLVIGNAGAETRLYLNDGSGRFLDHTPLLPIRADATLWVGAANVDGDADEDLLVLNAAPGPPRLYLSVEPSTHATP